MSPFQILTVLAMRSARGTPWTEAYAAWRSLVTRLAAGRVPCGKDSKTMPPELREEIAEEVLVRVALKAGTLVESIVPRAVAAPVDLRDRALVLAPPGSEEWRRALEAADRVVVSYVRVALGNRLVDHFRSGSRRAERELRETSKEASQAYGPHVADPASDEDDERALRILMRAAEDVVEAAADARRAEYAEQREDLFDLARRRRTMDALLLREFLETDDALADRARLTAAQVSTRLAELPSDELVETMAEAVEVLDAPLLRRRFERWRASPAGRRADAAVLAPLEAAIVAFEALSLEAKRSKDGIRVRDKLYARHMRLRDRIRANIQSMLSRGEVDAADTARAHALVGELLMRRASGRQIPGPPASEGEVKA